MTGIQTIKSKFNFNPKLTKRIVALVIIAAIGVTGVTVYLRKGNSSQVAVTQQTATVKKGDFSISITGTGTISSTSTASVSAKTGGTVTKIYYVEGDTVKTGDLLYEMDDSSAKLDIEKIKNNIATAQLSAQDNLNSISKLNIIAPFTGIITSIPVKEGDSISKGGQVATLVDQSKLKLTVPFKVASLNGIGVGNSVLVHIQTIMQTIEGTVNLVSSPIPTSDGMQMVNLEITVPNTGTLKEGLKGNVEITTSTGSVFSTDTGSLSYINSATIKTDTGGTVTQINVKEGQSVASGAAIVTLTSNDLQITKQSNDIKLKDLNSQLDTAVKQLEYYKVYSTIDGTITKQSLHVGDAVKVAEVITTISNVKQLQCSIPIDELDISKVKVGQKTTITADALTETVKKPLVGAVTSIGVSGTTTSGVTTYPVVISIPYTDGMRPGMNISAEIFVQDKQNTLTVPIEAIQKVGSKNYVIVKGGTGNGYDELTKLIQSNRQSTSGNSKNSNSTNKSSSSSNKSSNSSGANSNKSNSSSTTNKSSTSSSNKVTSAITRSNTSNSSKVNFAEYYKNTTLKEVELGINNESYIEVLSGVSEGDEIVLSPKTTSQSSSSSQNAAGAVGGMGMMGGAQGGPPPSGGGRD